MTRGALAVALMTGCFTKPPFDLQQVDAGSDAGLGEPNIAFVTSSTYTVNELGGLAGADERCQALANAAGLAPNTYVAWLSSVAEPAVVRLGTARGWIRRDGKPFVDTVADLITGRLFHPLRIDETGADTTQQTVATATEPTGTLDPQDCSGLMGGTLERIATGVSDATRDRWTHNGSMEAQCDAQVRLYCFGIDRHAPVVPVPAARRLAFVSTPWQPSGGRVAADAVCAVDAAAAGLSGTFVALLAISGESAGARLPTNGLPWSRVDGIPLAATTEEVIAGRIDASLNLTADGVHLGDTLAWTGITGSTLLSAAANNCFDWTQNSGSTANAGNLVRTNDLWYRSQSGVSCSSERRLYCFEQ